VAKPTNPNTILLRGFPLRTEIRARTGEAIKPGMLMAYHTDGYAIKHAGDGLRVTPLVIALENPYFVPTSVNTETIETAYQDGELVYGALAQQGDEYYMLLATGNNVTAFVSPLVSNGDGTLKTATVDATTIAGSVIGVPLQSINNTSGSPVRIRVRIDHV